MWKSNSGGQQKYGTGSCTRFVGKFRKCHQPGYNGGDFPNPMANRNDIGNKSNVKNHPSG